MVKIPFAVWIANAAARLAGTYGDVTRQAEAAACSRQTVYDHAQTSFRQLRLGFRRNSFGDGPGIISKPLSWCHATTISPLNPRCPAL